jgi:hypothetical protein
VIGSHFSFSLPNVRDKGREANEIIWAGPGWGTWKGKMVIGSCGRGTTGGVAVGFKGASLTPGSVPPYRDPHPGPWLQPDPLDTCFYFIVFGNTRF